MTVTTLTPETKYRRKYNITKKSEILTDNQKKMEYERSEIDIILFSANNQAAIKLVLNHMNYLYAKYTDIYFHKKHK